MKYKIGDRVYFQGEKYQVTGVFHSIGLSFVSLMGFGSVPDYYVKPIHTCK